MLYIIKMGISSSNIVFDCDKLKLRFGDNIYTFQKDIGHGAFGLIASFRNDENESNEIVVKIMANKVNMVETKSLNIVCNSCCVRSTMLHDGYIQVMDRMDGDLVNYITSHDELDSRMISGILQSIHHQLTCIDRLCGVYTDIKCANILYKEHHDEKLLEIHLGDMRYQGRVAFECVRTEEETRIHISLSIHTTA